METIIANRVSRRDSLKTMGDWVGGAFFPWSMHARNEHGEPLILPDDTSLTRLAEPVTAVTLGAGSRGNVYGDYAAEYPDRLRIVAVAEPIPIRQERYARKHAIADNRQRLYVFDLPDDRTEWDSAILDYLRTTDYGRCVYRMDNDQCDHYVANILFAGGVTASFSMEAFTPFGGRRTRVMGSMGYIEGDMSQMRIVDFRTRQSTVLQSSALDVDQFAADGHGGGDWRLVANWVEAVATRNASLLSSTIDVSIESHLMGFAAEHSRRNGTVEPIRLQ